MHVRVEKLKVAYLKLTEMISKLQDLEVHIY